MSGKFYYRILKSSPTSSYWGTICTERKANMTDRIRQLESDLDATGEDVELEGADEGDLEGTDTGKVSFKYHDFRLTDLASMFDEGSLKLDADWQRGYVWTPQRASRLIESFLIDLPVPVIYLAENDDYELEVIDGLQRLTSIFDFLRNRLKLTRLERRTDLNGRRFKDLEKSDQNKLRKSTLRTIEFHQTSDKNLKYLMFERLNTGGVALNEMEIRNCIYRGKLNDLIKELAQFKEFKESVNQKNIHKRMKDRTLVLRFLAFYQMTYSKARQGLKAFFNDFCDAYRNPSEKQLNEFRNKFKYAMKTAFTVFGDRGFKLKLTSRSVNASIFQVICVSFTDYDQGALTRSADAIRKAYSDLIKTDPHWVDCVSTSTSSYNRISYTFETWNERLKQVMENVEPNDPQRLFPRGLKEDLYNQSKECEICGQQIAHIDDAVLDHDKQHWQGGKTVSENARLVHRHCNATRSRSEAPAKTTRIPLMRVDEKTSPPSNRSNFTAFTFCNQRYELDHDYEYLVKFSETLSQMFEDQFEKKVLELRGQNGAVWFSRKKEGVLRSRLVPGTDIYVATNFGNDVAKKRVKLLAELFNVEEPVVE